MSIVALSRVFSFRSYLSSATGKLRASKVVDPRVVLLLKSELIRYIAIMLYPQVQRDLIDAAYSETRTIFDSIDLAIEKNGGY